MGASKKFFKTLATMKRMVKPSLVEKEDTVSCESSQLCLSYVQLKVAVQDELPILNLWYTFHKMNRHDLALNMQSCGDSNCFDNLQKNNSSEKQRRWVPWKTSVESNRPKEYDCKDMKRTKKKLADLMKKVDNYLLSSTNQRQISLENWAALRIQTAFRGFLVYIVETV